MEIWAWEHFLFYIISVKKASDKISSIKDKF